MIVMLNVIISLKSGDKMLHLLTQEHLKNILRYSTLGSQFFYSSIPLDSRTSDSMSDQEDITEDDQMIDDLFEGVTTIDDDVIEPHMTDKANGKPTLTRQKSRQEIRSELTVVGS